MLVGIMVALSPPTVARKATVGTPAVTAANVSLDRPVFLRAGAVICPEIDVLSAYIDGRQAGGDDEGHRAVQRLFLRAGGECIRTIDRDQVRGSTRRCLAITW
jgi:hypothetical protein